MVVIRLKRIGRKKSPFYRIVVADSHVQRDGKVIEEIGYYSPKISPNEKVIKPISLNNEKYTYWVSKGAMPTDSVRSIVKQVQKG
jgi:small subunit ribosomal protein S16